MGVGEEDEDEDEDEDGRGEERRQITTHNVLVLVTLRRQRTENIRWLWCELLRFMDDDEKLGLDEISIFSGFCPAYVRVMESPWKILGIKAR